MAWITQAQQLPYRFIITTSMKKQLGELGYSPEEISDMRPADAAKIISGAIRAPKADPIAAAVQDRCEHCRQSDGVIAPYCVGVTSGGRHLTVTAADGDHGDVFLHSICWFAWERREAKRRGLRPAGWGSPQTRAAQ